MKREERDVDAVPGSMTKCMLMSLKDDGKGYTAHVWRLNSKGGREVFDFLLERYTHPIFTEAGFGPFQLTGFKGPILTSLIQSTILRTLMKHTDVRIKEGSKPTFITIKSKELPTIQCLRIFMELEKRKPVEERPYKDMAHFMSAALTFALNYYPKYKHVDIDKFEAGGDPFPTKQKHT